MKKPRLMDQVRDRIRTLHYSIRTEEAYTGWIKRFILFHDKQHPAEMGKPEIETFLTHLAVKRNVSAGSQNQALNAILFLYRQVLKIDVPWLENVTRARKPQRLPVVLTRDEIEAVFSHMDGTCALIAKLLYGTGMRLMEGIRLRVKDMDFTRNEIIVTKTGVVSHDALLVV